MKGSPALALRWRSRGRLAAAIAAVAAVAVLLARSYHPAVPGTVEKVIDGDTVVLSGGEHVRLLGIDAPELHPGRPGRAGPFPEPGAVEACEALRALVEGRTLRVERRGRDRYGRTLARLRLPDGRDVSEELLKRRLVEPYEPQRR
jgi:endonuclease YncB( thermonuclease family)